MKRIHMYSGEESMRRWRRGSLTAEAAGIMGVLLLVIFFLIYTEFYVMNRDWLTISACEAAITGSMAEALEEGKGLESAKKRAEELGNTGYCLLSELTCRAYCDSSVRVSYTGNMNALFGGYTSGMNCSGEYRNICPSDLIRKIRLAERIINKNE